MSEALLKSVLENIPANLRADVRPVLEDSSVPAVLRADTVRKMHLKWWKEGLDKRYETEDQLYQLVFLAN
jgi:regulator of sigma D